MENNLIESEFIFYRDNKNKISIQVIVNDETIWLSQKSMAELFGVDVRTINEHLQNIFSSHELIEDSTIRNFRIVQPEGTRQVQREIQIYNLDAIIAVGYRVNSYNATQFRIWATGVLREYMIKGFALDDERLKQGKTLFGKDYFDELLERIKVIRASERRFYQKITDIYAQCSIDYDAQSPITQEFYAIVQNKLHYAISHQTAAEIIKSRVSSDKENMGLTTWKNAPDGTIQKTDVSVAKNYLKQEEISELNSIVNMYLDFAELQAKRNITMKMSDWIRRLDDFLKFNEYDILTNAGTISSKIAKSIAEKEYEKYKLNHDKVFKSDFDKVVDEIKTTGKMPSTSTINISKILNDNSETIKDNPAKKTIDLNELRKNNNSKFDETLGALMKVPKPEK